MCDACQSTFDLAEGFSSISSNYPYTTFAELEAAVACAPRNNQLRAHQLTSGVLASTVAADTPTLIVADPCAATPTLYASTNYAVSTLEWNGSALMSAGSM